MFKCRDDFVFNDARPSKTPRNSDRNGGPYIHYLPKRSPIRAKKLEIEAAWWCIYDLSPPPAYLDQRAPLPDAIRGPIGWIVTIPASIKYFKQVVVWEDANRYHIPVPFTGPTELVPSVLTAVAVTILEDVPCTSKFSSSSWVMFRLLSGPYELSPSFGKRRLLQDMHWQWELVRKTKVFHKPLRAHCLWTKYGQSSHSWTGVTILKGLKFELERTRLEPD